MADLQEKLITLLQQFGLSLNACKAYVSLLKNNPATGYEISSQSAIPRSAIYATLNRLESMGLVNSEGDTPKKYIPLAPSQLIDHLNSNHTENINGLTPHDYEVACYIGADCVLVANGHVSIARLKQTGALVFNNLDGVVKWFENQVKT